MLVYLRRLASTGASYTASSVISKLFAVALLPVYTRHLTRADYGAAEVLLATVVALSIVFRLGIVEALLRFYYQEEQGGDLQADRPVRGGTKSLGAAVSFLFIAITVGSLLVAAFAGPLSEALLDQRDTELMLIAAGGLWVFTLYELMMALFRLDERARAYFAASLTNVLLTIALTVWLVVFEDEGARGLLLGNFGGSALVLAALLWIHRARLGLVPSRARLGEMLRFGLPTMPAELSLYALNFVDRVALARLAGLAEAGLYALAVKFSQAVTVIVRGFNLAWPPLAYSIRDDDTARRTYSVVITYYLLLAFTVVLALSLEARWVVRALAAPDFFDAYKAVPLVSTGVALYALYLVLSVSVSRTGPHGLQLPGHRRGAGGQHRPQPGAHPSVRAGRRGDRAGRRLRRDDRADVRRHPAHLPPRPGMGTAAAHRRDRRLRCSRSASCCCPRPASPASSREGAWRWRIYRSCGRAASSATRSGTRCAAPSSARAARQRSRRRIWKPCAPART